MAVLTDFGISTLILSLNAAVVSFLVYRAFFHPLARIPGPFIARLTSSWLWHHAYNGTEATAIQDLHKQYGPIVRIGPNEVNIDDGAAIQSIYVKNGGLPKNPCYANFDIDGYPTIFSTLDQAHRNTRSKLVVGMFAQQAIRDGEEAIKSCVDKMVDRLRKTRDQSNGQPVDILNTFRSLAIDVVTTYLFHKPYNGLEEESLSAQRFVDSFVEVGKLFYLPKLVFTAVSVVTANYAQERDSDRRDTWKSMVAVDQYSATLIDSSVAVMKKGEEEGEDTSYQGRMLKAGLDREEVIAQCQDLMFAGTDSTGTNLSTIVFNLVMNPDIHDKLKAELEANSGADAQSLPYLSAVIKEGLRMGLANPTRIPRIVGPEGLELPGNLPRLPHGTSVSVCIQALHMNPKVFPEPHVFQPERWLDASAEMTRDAIPWGAGTRSCIARNLALAEIYWAIEAIVRSDVLRDSAPVRDKIQIIEWFNSRIKDGKVELVWPKQLEDTSHNEIGQ